ncbi:MAG TPA: hypothetical protein VFM76_06205, partial [Methylophaga sp.]|nr:hypothetical protein [Methylophaga sp.]
KLQVTAQAEAEYLNPAEALEHILVSLKQQGWQGKQTIVLTPSAMSAMVELPVSPKKPKPIGQMHELVRWEVEPLLMQHQSQWTLGFLLECYGFISAEQANEIQETQKKQTQSLGAPRGPDRPASKRYGELALEFGYVTREQVQSLFVVQDWLRSEEDEVQCGWSPQGEVEDAPGVWNWLVTACYASTLHKWQELCEDNGLQLSGLMPSTGNSLALLDQADKSSIILESNALTTTALCLHRQNVIAVHHHVNRGGSMLDAILEVYHSENISQNPAVLLACPAEQLPQLQETLKAAIGHEVNLLPEHNPEAISPAALASARNFFNMKGGNRISLVRQGGPLPPPLQRQENQAVILFAGIIFLILLAETFTYFQHSAVSAEKAEIDARAKVLDDAIARINAQRAEIDKRKAELETQQQNQRRMESRLAFFGEEMPERAMLVQAILGIVQNTVNEQIIINRIDEMGRRVGIQPDSAPVTRPGYIVKDNFNIDAWALTESAGQEFVQNMKLAVAAWDMEVRDIQVMEKIGPMNMPGYSVSMSLLHLIPQSEAVQCTLNN